jgi:polysaccharide export outer membrane protein
MRLSEVLAAAGGITRDGDETVVVSGMRDGKPFRKEIDTSALMAGQRGDDIVVMSGDTVYVNKAPTYYVYGEAQKPGPYRVERGMTVMQALAAAGGLNQRGTLRGMRVTRKDEAGRTRDVELKLTDTLRPDDVVTVRESIF